MLTAPAVGTFALTCVLSERWTQKQKQKQKDEEGAEFPDFHISRSSVHAANSVWSLFSKKDLEFVEL